MIYRDIDYLHPHCRKQFQNLKDRLIAAWKMRDTETRFAVFETYRTPMRQMILREQKPVVTKANAWYSAHNYGLAVDFVPLDEENKWSWDRKWDYEFLREMAANEGLSVPLGWDLCHVESPVWRDVKKFI